MGQEGSEDTDLRNFSALKKKIVTKEKSFPEWGYYKTD